MSRQTTQISIGIGLVAFGVMFRLLPHIPNVTPLTAIALFSGSVLSRKIASWVPVITMILSDVIIGFYGPTMLITWSCFALIALASSLWFRRLTLARGVLLCCSASVFFYIVTNFAVWLYSGMYVHSWSGLLLCYALALPFLRNMILGDLFFSGALYGGYAYVHYRHSLAQYRIKTSVHTHQTHQA